MTTNEITLHVAGGVDAVSSSGLGFSSDIGYIWPTDAEGGAGMFSGDVIYELGASRQVIPQLRAGYTLLFGSGTSSLINSGVGFTRWFSGRKAIKFEIRDHFFVGDPGDHLVEVVVGVVLTTN